MYSLDVAVVDAVQSGINSFVATTAVWLGSAPETATYPFASVARGATKQTTRFFGRPASPSPAFGKRLEYVPYTIALLSTSAAQASQMADSVFNILDNESLTVNNGGVSVCWVNRMPVIELPNRDASGNTVYRAMIQATFLAGQIDT